MKLRSFLPCFLLSLGTIFISSYAWKNIPKMSRSNADGTTRKQVLGDASKTVASSMLLFTGCISSSPAWAASALNQVGGGQTLREKGRPSLVEALVYLPNGINYWGELLQDKEEERISNSSMNGKEEEIIGGAEALFLTVSYQGKIILGARVPMEGIIFPFLAQFYPANIISGNMATWERVKDKDLVVKARVCSSGEYPPCEKALLRAASISKYLPEVKDGSSQKVIARNVRIGASLMLQRADQATMLDTFSLRK